MQADIKLGGVDRHNRQIHSDPLSERRLRKQILLVSLKLFLDDLDHFFVSSAGCPLHLISVEQPPGRIRD